jgi:hypothetical protein
MAWTITTRNSVRTEMWLGYVGLSVPCDLIMAVVHYQPAWDRRIAQSHGALPPDVCCVVLLEDGRALPARRSIEDLRRQWAAWQAERAP